MRVLADPDLVRLVFAGRSATADPWALERQVRACQSVLPDNAVIVAYFYDVGSGMLDPAQRGRRGHAHEMVQIPVPRDGGIADLLAEAERPDRRFDAVICESIDRIARRTYIGTDIEHRLERAGVRLLAAVEPFQLGTNGVQ